MTADIRPSGLSPLIGASVARTGEGSFRQIKAREQLQGTASSEERSAEAAALSAALESSVSNLSEAAKSVRSIAGSDASEDVRSEISSALVEASQSSAEDVEEAATTLARDVARQIETDPDQALAASNQTPIAQLISRLSTIFSR